MINLQHFRSLNLARCNEDFGHQLSDWSVAEWGNATAGEVGEACNVAKKIIRIRDQINGNKDSETMRRLRSRLADELADVFIYLDLWAASFDIDLETAIIKKWNETSQKIGSKKRL